MLYPTLSPEETSRDFIDVFGGYNHNYRINDNEFYNMKNLTSSSYPLLASRGKRGNIPYDLLPKVGIPCGAVYQSAFYTVSFYGGVGSSALHLYKDGVEIAGFSQDEGVVMEPIERKLIMTGAYIIILPDKVYVNTEDTDDRGPIEAEVSTNNNTQIQLCTADGSPVEIDYAGKTAPENPTDGYIWLDTSNDPPMIKKYFAGSAMWAADIANYIKLAGEDLAYDFKEGDGVNLSGITAESFKHLNGTTILKTKPDDDTIVLNARFESVDGNYRFFEVFKKYGARAALDLISDQAVSQDQFVGKTFIIGGQKAVCVSNTASSPQQGWHISSNIMLTNMNNTLKSINEYQNIAASSASVTSSRLYVQLSEGETIIAPPTGGTPVQIGEDEADTSPYPLKMITVDSQSGYIQLNNAAGIEVPAETIIYPLEYGDLEGRNKFTISFATSFIANKETTVLIEPDFITTQSTPITISRKMPNMDFVIESNNRLWGCRYGENNGGDTVNEIYASKLGDFKNWQCYEGTSTDSYAASCGTDGAWTGAISFLSKPVFFKENYIHTVYGSYPAQYQINSVAARGVQQGSDKSLAILNETLLYLSTEGVLTYNGSLPVNISYAFGDIQYHDGNACSYKGKYYIEQLDENDNPVLMVYDAKRDMWHKEDSINALVLCPVRDDVYYITDDSGFRSLFGTGSKDIAPVEWFAETGIFGLSQIDSKYISRINLRLSLDRGANVIVSIQYDNSTRWEKLCNVIRKDINPFTLPIKPRRCDHFRLRIEGKGQVKIYSISKTLAQGSDRT